MSEFHKNGIITGLFDSFCLLCEVHLKQNASEHIDVPDHKGMLQQSSYVPKYQSHHIRKVSLGYYCEFCNILVPTLAKIALHVASEDHLKLKENQLLKEVEEGIIAFDKLLISKKAWNGLVDDTCLLCNVEFVDENEHVKESSHILKLIQSEVKVKSCDSMIYRNVDSSILHCLTCNDVIGINVMETHFEGEDHLKKIRQCCDDKKNLDNKHCDTENKNNERTKSDMNGKELRANDNSDGLIPQAEIRNIEKNIKDKKDSEVKINSEEIRKADCEIIGNKEMLHPFAAIEKAKVLAKENHITYKLGKQSAFCKVCNVTISSSIKRLKEHVDEGPHKENLKKKKNVSKNTEEQKHIVKIASHEFVYEIMHSKLSNCFAINNEIYIRDISFMMITENNSVMRCQLCQEKVSSASQHSQTLGHRRRMWLTPIIANLKTEFVREIRPEIYHCGFCNLVAGNWQELSLHLRSEAHASTKRQLNIYGSFIFG